MNVLPDWGENSISSTLPNNVPTYHQPSLFDEDTNSPVDELYSVSELMDKFLATIKSMQEGKLLGIDVNLADYISGDTKLKETILLKNKIVYDPTGPIPFPKISNPPVNLNEHLSKYKDNGIDLELPF